MDSTGVSSGQNTYSYMLSVTVYIAKIGKKDSELPGTPPRDSNVQVTQVLARAGCERAKAAHGKASHHSLLRVEHFRRVVPGVATKRRGNGVEQKKMTRRVSEYMYVYIQYVDLCVCVCVCVEWNLLENPFENKHWVRRSSHTRRPLMFWSQVWPQRRPKCELHKHDTCCPDVLLWGGCDSRVGASHHQFWCEIKHVANRKHDSFARLGCVVESA